MWAAKDLQGDDINMCSPTWEANREGGYKNVNEDL